MKLFRGVVMNNRRCTICGHEGPEDDFPRVYMKPSERQKICRACRYKQKIERTRERRRKNRADWKAGIRTHGRLIDKVVRPWKQRPEDAIEIALMNDCLEAGVFPHDDDEWLDWCKKARATSCT